MSAQVKSVRDTLPMAVPATQPLITARLSTSEALIITTARPPTTNHTAPLSIVENHTIDHALNIIDQARPKAIIDTHLEAIVADRPDITVAHPVNQGNP